MPKIKIKYPKKEKFTPQFLSEVKNELAKVSWPTKKIALQLTVIVIGVSLAVAFYLGGIDFLFNKLISFLL